MAEKILMSEFRALAKEPWTNIELVDENIFLWDVAIIPVNPESMYYGGYFQARMLFPKDYPFTPPKFTFKSPVTHPNVYKDGRLCISILHPPGEDEMSGELAAERWSPAQRVESVLISILSLLDDAEISSPANVDAAKLLRDQPAAFRASVAKDVEASKLMIPAGFEMPTQVSASYKKEEAAEAMFSWSDSEAEDDFGGSESDVEFDSDDEDGESMDVEESESE